MPQGMEAALLGKWGWIADLAQLAYDAVGWVGCVAVVVVGIVIGVAWSMLGGDDVDV